MARTRHGAAKARRPAARCALAQDGTQGTLYGAVSRPGFHALLCGPVAMWRTGAVAELEERFTGVLTVHYVTATTCVVCCTTTPERHHAGSACAARARCRSSSGPTAISRTRGRGIDLTGLHAYLEQWLTNEAPC